MRGRPRRIVGSVVQVPLGDGSHSYGQILAEADFAFFDIRSSGPITAAEVVNRPVLFRVAVMNHAVTSGRWPIVGSAPIRSDLQRPQQKFIQDKLNPNQFEIYFGGQIRPASREECAGLEAAAVWEPEHVEDRLRDHFAGRSNKWLESLCIHPE